MTKTVIVDRRSKPASIIHDEIKAMQSPDNGQRDDREASTPSEDLPNRFSGLPDGWRWAGNKVVPTKDAVRDKVEYILNIFNERDGREAEIDVMKDVDFKKFTSGLKQYLAETKNFNDFVFMGNFYSALNNLINSLHFFQIYERKLDQLASRGEHDDDTQVKQAESRKQALAAASTLDCVLELDSDITIDWESSVYKFLVRQGEWIKENFGKPQRRTQPKGTNSFFNKSEATGPESAAEQPEDEINF